MAWCFLIGGAAEIGIGAHAQAWSKFFLWMIGGVLYLFVGLVCIFNSGFASVALTLLLGAGLIAAGGVRVYLALQLPVDQSARDGVHGRGDHHPAGADHRHPLASQFDLGAGNTSRRRFVVQRRRMGEVRTWPSRPALTGGSKTFLRGALRSPPQREPSLFQGTGNDEMGLFFRRRKSRGKRRDARSARRQRAPIWPKCPISACPCRRASPSPPKSARTSTPIPENIRNNWSRRSRPRWRRWPV